MKAPKIDSKRYKEIVKRGCKLERTQTEYGYELDCGHDYKWFCEDCPCVIEKHKNDYKETKNRR